MQSLIEDLDFWQKDNNMMFNNTKIQVLQFGRDDCLKSDYIYLSLEASELIAPVEYLRDFMVIVNNNMDLELLT